MASSRLIGLGVPQYQQGSCTIRLGSGAPSSTRYWTIGIKNHTTAGNRLKALVDLFLFSIFFLFALENPRDYKGQVFFTTSQLSQKIHQAVSNSSSDFTTFSKGPPGIILCFLGFQDISNRSIGCYSLILNILKRSFRQCPALCSSSKNYYIRSNTHQLMPDFIIPLLTFIGPKLNASKNVY